MTNCLSKHAVMGVLFPAQKKGAILFPFVNPEALCISACEDG